MLHAQPWMPAANTAPLKLNDIIASYKKHPYYTEDEGPENIKEPKETKDHLFQRWVWYMKQHCDDNGYMVSPMKTLIEWQKYQDQNNSVHTANKTTGHPSNWLFQGPHQSNSGYSGIGRINIVAFDPTDSNTFYIGSAAGSTWKTTDGAASWSSLYDNLPTLGVSDIKINPLNHNTIYVATGDGDAGDAFSSGVIKSNDGGLHWQITGLNWPATAYLSARSLLINPLDTNSLIMASNNGIYKSHDGGQNWNNVSGGDFKQILYNPNDTSIVYGSMYVNTSSVNTAQIMRSVNGGITWDTITNFPAAQRINFAVCPAAPNIVKAVVSSHSSSLQGIYSSTDSGASFTGIFIDTNCTNNILGYNLGLPTTTCDGQGWYDLCISINPNDPSKITVGGVNTYYSADSGYTWQIVNQWWGGIGGLSTVHADKHCLAYNPLNGALFESCDGGIYKTYDQLAGPWTDLTNGLGITEFYRNAVDNGVTFCLGGAQDNGTKMLDAGVGTDLTGGDGMQCRINYGDPAHIWYSSYPGGSIDMTRDAGTSYNNITNSLTGAGSGSWLSPYLIYPADTATLLLAYKCVYITYDNGNNWSALSPVFDTNYNINQIAISLSNSNYVYTTTDNYNTWKSDLHYTPDFGTTWDTIPVPFTNFISDITVDTKNEKVLWVTIGGYGINKVFKYDLNTQLWYNFSGSLPDIPVSCILIDTSSHTQYIGTDAAVFYKDTTMSDWALFNNHLPAVHISDLNINYTTNEIWAATFGRGMWKSAKSDIRPSSLPVIQQTADALTIFPDPNKGIFTIHTSSKELLAQQVSLTIYSSEGKTVLHKNTTFNSAGKLSINAAFLKPGNYICELSSKAMRTRCRFVVY